MSVQVLLHLPVTAGEGPGLGVVAAAEAASVAAARGVWALRLPDRAGLLDPTLVAGRLSPVAAGTGLIVEASTRDHAPYNLARRVASLARAHLGPVGVALRADGVDPLTRRHSGPDGRRQAEQEDGVREEYEGLLAALWASFPADALVGDAESARFADVTRIVPPRHCGENYRVAGALNVPTDPDREPFLLDEASFARVLVAVADDEDGARRRLAPIEAESGRAVVVGSGEQVAAELSRRAAAQGLRGFDVATYPSLHAVRDVAERVVPRVSSSGSSDPGLSSPVGVAR